MTNEQKNQQILQIIINQFLQLFEILLLDFDWSEKLNEYRKKVTELRMQKLGDPTNSQLDVMINRVELLIKVLEYIVDLKK
jgi:hypothetical protein